MIGSRFFIQGEPGKAFTLTNETVQETETALFSGRLVLFFCRKLFKHKMPELGFFRAAGMYHIVDVDTMTEAEMAGQRIIVQADHAFFA